MLSETFPPMGAILFTDDTDPEPSAPLVTVNVDVLPFVYVMVYVSTSPLVPVFVMDAMPLPVAPVAPVSPLGIPKLKIGSVDVPELVTVALDPAGRVDVWPIVMVMDASTPLST